MSGFGDMNESCTELEEIIQFNEVVPGDHKNCLFHC